MYVVWDRDDSLDFQGQKCSFMLRYPSYNSRRVHAGRFHRMESASERLYTNPISWHTSAVQEAFWSFLCWGVRQRGVSYIPHSYYSLFERYSYTKNSFVMAMSSNIFSDSDGPQRRHGLVPGIMRMFTDDEDFEGKVSRGLLQYLIGSFNHSLWLQALSFNFRQSRCRTRSRAWELRLPGALLTLTLTHSWWLTVV